MHEDDFVAHAAISVFRAVLERHVVNLPLNPGCFLSFNNLRGAHKREAIGDGDRLILRTYALQDVTYLREVSKINGPIFPIGPVSTVHQSFCRTFHHSDGRISCSRASTGEKIGNDPP